MRRPARGRLRKPPRETRDLRSPPRKACRDDHAFPSIVCRPCRAFLQPPTPDRLRLLRSFSLRAFPHVQVGFSPRRGCDAESVTPFVTIPRQLRGKLSAQQLPSRLTDLE